MHAVDDIASARYVPHVPETGTASPNASDPHSDGDGLSRRCEQLRELLRREARARTDAERDSQRRLLNIGSLIRRGRTLGMSVTEMADISGVSRSTAYLAMDRADERPSARRPVEPGVAGEIPLRRLNGTPHD